MARIADLISCLRSGWNKRITFAACGGMSGRKGITPSEFWSLDTTTAACGQMSRASESLCEMCVTAVAF